MIGFPPTLDYETKLATDKSPILSDLMDPVKSIDEVKAWMRREELITALGRNDDFCLFLVKWADLSLLPLEIRNDHLLLICRIYTLKLTRLAEYRSHKPSPWSVWWI